MRGGFWILVVVLLGGVVALVQRVSPGGLTGAMSDSDQRLRLIYLFLILAALSVGLAARLQARPGSTLAQFGIWVLIFAGVILAYSFRSDFTGLKDRLIAELVPGQGAPAGDKAIAFPLDADGHYHVYATVDGAMIPFMVDTGASDVVLTPSDARQLGLDPASLDYTMVADTANGRVRGAPIVINVFKVGPIIVNDLPATVNEADMPVSLLGMEFLRRLKGWRVEDGRLTLQQ